MSAIASLQKPHSKSIGHYFLGKTIGEGTFGKVKLGTHILTGEKVAVKVLEKERIVEVADVERVAREVHILKLIRHPHIIQLYEIIETRRQLHLIMEYASGGELFDYIVANGRVPEEEACRFFHQIIAGVEKIHMMNVVHRDLKPENLLLDEYRNIKIVDFGLSNFFRDGKLLKTACGSPCYAAPEMIAGKEYVPGLCDLWSCGVILFALVCGHLPFEDQNTAALYKKILAADFQMPKFLSSGARSLIAGLLTTDPARRLTIPLVRSHQWYRQIAESSLQPSKFQVVEEDVLEDLETFGLPPDYAARCLELNKHNHVTTTYFLLVEKKRRIMERLMQPQTDYQDDFARFEEPLVVTQPHMAVQGHSTRQQEQPRPGEPVTSSTAYPASSALVSPRPNSHDGRYYASSVIPGVDLVSRYKSPPPVANQRLDAQAWVGGSPIGARPASERDPVSSTHMHPSRMQHAQQQQQQQQQLQQHQQHAQQSPRKNNQQQDVSSLPHTPRQEMLTTRQEVTTPRQEEGTPQHPEINVSMYGTSVTSSSNHTGRPPAPASARMHPVNSPISKATPYSTSVRTHTTSTSPAPTPRRTTTIPGSPGTTTPVDRMASPLYTDGKTQDSARATPSQGVASTSRSPGTTHSSAAPRIRTFGKVLESSAAAKPSASTATTTAANGSLSARATFVARPATARTTRPTSPVDGSSNTTTHSVSPHSARTYGASTSARPATTMVSTPRGTPSPPWSARDSRPTSSLATPTAGMPARPATSSASTPRSYPQTSWASRPTAPRR